MKSEILVLKPPVILKVASVLSLAMGGMTLGYLLREWADLTVLGVGWFTLGTVVFVSVGVDALQRRYEIDRSQVRIRILFFWITRVLPAEVSVTRNVRRQIVLAGSLTKKTILRIPWTYDRGGRTFSLLRGLFPRRGGAPRS